MFGIIEVITLLLGLTGFGIQPNPKAPTADQSLQYAMPDADVVLHFDAASVIPGNYKVLTGLPNQPAIKASPELSKTVRQVIGEIEGARGLAKTATGIDFTTDLNDMTVFVQVVAKGDPNFVAVVHGKFSTALVERVAKMGKGTVQRTNNGMILDMGPTEPSVAVTKDGILLAGSPALITARLADAWKAPARAPGSNLAFTADVINARPVYAMVMSLSQSARAQALAHLGSKNFPADLVRRHKQASFSIFADGVGWTWIDSSKAGMDSMALMSEGAMDMMKAAQIAPRGFAKIMLGALDSYRGTDKQIDELIRRKADLMKLVETYTGDGNFKVQIDRDPKLNKVTARATGKTLSEVVPLGLVLPGAAVGLLLRGVEQKPMPPTASQSSTIAVPPPVPAKKGGVKAPLQPSRHP